MRLARRHFAKRLQKSCQATWQQQHGDSPSVESGRRRTCTFRFGRPPGRFARVTATGFPSVFFFLRGKICI